MNNCIEIFGVTPAASYPHYEKDCPCSQISMTDKLCIPVPYKKTFINIKKVFVDICDCTFKKICTPVSEKIVINAIKHIKVYYSSSMAKKLCCIDFDIPFCMFIPIDNCHHNIIDVFIGIENISVCCTDCNELFVSTIIFACPIFKTTYHKCQKNCYECDNECNDECNHHYDNDECDDDCNCYYQNIKCNKHCSKMYYSC